MLQKLESILAFTTPLEDIIPTNSFDHGGPDFGELGDETSIGDRETDKNLNFLDARRGFPVLNGSDLLGVHTYTLGGDNQSEMADFGDMEF